MSPRCRSSASGLAHTSAIVYFPRTSKKAFLASATRPSFASSTPRQPAAKAHGPAEAAPEATAASAPPVDLTPVPFEVARARFIADTAKRYGLKPEQISTAPPQFTHPDGAINIESVRRDLAFYRSKGMINSETVKADDVVDMSFVAAAVKELGPYKRKP